jgi:hypothetical protein
MKSVADALRREERDAMLVLGAAERVALALRLGERDLESFRRAVDPAWPRAGAVRELERRRQAQRRRSACLESIIACRSSGP